MFLANLFISSALGLKRHWSHLVTLEISEQLTSYYLYMILNPSNALLTGKGLFVPNLMAIKHSKQFDLWLTPVDLYITFDHINALHFG